MGSPGMRILISNDDGYQSPGIRCLAEAVADVAEVLVVAPDRDRSGASNSLTLTRPLRPREVSPGVWAVDGTPTDCVHLGVHGVADFRPDMVLAGINMGPNMGDDVLYSGTVAAASEGRFLGYPAIALSMNSFEPEYFDSGARAALHLLARLSDHPLPRDTILNVNIPDLPWNDIKGFAATRQGRRHPSMPAIRQTDPRGRPVYWIGFAGEAQDGGPGTDFHAVQAGQVSVTPIHLNMTHRSVLAPLENWLHETA